ncbi:MAG: hypothetical protein QOJ19_1840 [Acidimicrobiia bacterium]|nr:hypothetical protein [Acidimicrobiia bacterium]
MRICCCSDAREQRLTATTYAARHREVHRTPPFVLPSIYQRDRVLQPRLDVLMCQYPYAGADGVRTRTSLFLGDHQRGHSCGKGHPPEPPLQLARDNSRLTLHLAAPATISRELHGWSSHGLDEESAGTDRSNRWLAAFGRRAPAGDVRRLVQGRRAAGTPLRDRHVAPSLLRGMGRSASQRPRYTPDRPFAPSAGHRTG